MLLYIIWIILFQQEIQVCIGTLYSAFFGGVYALFLKIFIHTPFSDLISAQTVQLNFISCADKTMLKDFVPALSSTFTSLNFSL